MSIITPQNPNYLNRIRQKTPSHVFPKKQKHMLQKQPAHQGLQSMELQKSATPPEQSRKAIYLKGVLAMVIGSTVSGICQEKAFLHNNTVLPRHVYTYVATAVLIKNLAAVLVALPFFLSQEAEAKSRAVQEVNSESKETKTPKLYYVVSSAFEFVLFYLNLTLLTLSRFPDISIYRSFKLVVVVFIGVFLPMADYGQNSTRLTKLAISTVITGGVFLYAFYNQKSNANPEQQVFSMILMGLLITLEALKAQWTIYFYHKHRPSSMNLFFWSSVYSLVYSLCAFIGLREFRQSIPFLINHPNTFYLLVAAAVCQFFNSWGYFYIAKYTKSYVTAFISIIQKLFSALVSIVIFSHKVVPLQLVGVAVIAIGVGLELLDQFLFQRQKQLKDRDQLPLPIEVEKSGA